MAAVMGQGSPRGLDRHRAKRPLHSRARTVAPIAPNRLRDSTCSIAATRFTSARSSPSGSVVALSGWTSWSSACAGSDEMTAPPDQATAGWSRSQRPWIRSVPTQDSDRGCSEWAVQQTRCAGGIAHIQACAAWARHDCFDSRGCFGLAMPLPRQRQSRRARLTAASARLCIRPAVRTGPDPPHYRFDESSDSCFGERPLVRRRRSGRLQRAERNRAAAASRTSAFALEPTGRALLLPRLDRGRPPQRRHRSATNALRPRHRVAGNMIARRPSGGASAFTALRWATVADPCWCSRPPLCPTLRTAMPCRPRGPDGDRQAVASRSRRRRPAPARAARCRPPEPPTGGGNVPAFCCQFSQGRG